jgi:hypothetical protein
MGRGGAADAPAPRAADTPQKATGAAEDSKRSAAADAAPAARAFRSGLYSPDTDHVFADAASPSAIFPTPPPEAGPIVVPVLISRSHSLPYLECLRHLAARGYRVVALVDARNEPWMTRAYGSAFQASGGSVELIPPELTATLWGDMEQQVVDVAEYGDDPASLAALMGRMGSDFTRALYAWMKRRLAELQPSLLVLDMFYGFAADIADELDLNYVATTSGLIPGLADAPWTRPLYTTQGEATTLGMSLAARLYASTVEPARMLRAALPALREARRVRKEVGVSAPKAALADPAARFRGRLTLVNTFFGHECARQLPPNVRLIGPVRSSGAASSADQGLQGEFASFVESLGGDNAKIALLSFGQNCALTAPRLRALLGGLKRLIDRGVLDGAVWSLSMTPEETLVAAGFREPGAVPETQILVRPWVPQKALLEHRAVRVFVSHGGTESSSEAFYAGKPVCSVPHFSDQPRNSRLIEDAGAGIFLSKRALTPEIVEQALERIVGGEGDDAEAASFRAAAARLRALAVSRGRLSTEVAADELEFLLHYGDAHLQQIGVEQMGWLKRNNVDLWLAGVGVCAAAGVAGVAALSAIARRRA